MVAEMNTGSNSNEMLGPKLRRKFLCEWFLALPQNRVDLLPYVYSRRLWTGSYARQNPSGSSMNFLNDMKD